MTEREKAHKELQHALSAMADKKRAQRPMVSIVNVLAARDEHAGRAWREATYWLACMGSGLDEARRKLAPVMLDCILDARGIE